MYVRVQSPCKTCRNYRIKSVQIQRTHEHMLITQPYNILLLSEHYSLVVFFLTFIENKSIRT